MIKKTCSRSIVIPVTDYVGSSCDTRQAGMKTRTLATLLLASVVCWSLTPVTVAALTTPTVRSSTTAVAQERSCCPAMHPPAWPSVFATIPPATMPCDSRHPCCMQQPPENSPALPALRIGSRPDLHVLHFCGNPAENTPSQSVVAAPFPLNVSELSLLRSMVLRI